MKRFREMGMIEWKYYMRLEIVLNNYVQWQGLEDRLYIF